MKRCQRKCKLSEDGTHCVGCLRSMEEIKAKFKKVLDN